MLFDDPPQPRQPFEAAAGAYCARKHDDIVEEYKCREQGRCHDCVETVALIIRTWSEAALTRGDVR